MNRILVACASKECAQHGLRAASDLSAANGASLSLVYVRSAPRVSGLDAIGLLSNALFEEAQRSPVWLASLRQTVQECWEAPEYDLTRLAASRLPDLVMTCDEVLARAFVESTATPVWHIPPRLSGRSWFTSRRIRCAISGDRAASWAGHFASGLGAELETVRARLLGREPADLVVVDRARRPPLLPAWPPPPLVFV